MKYQLIIIIYLLIGFSSCVTHEEIVNFNQGGDFPQQAQNIADIPPMRIQADDLLSIRIKTLNPDVAIPFNIDGDNVNLAAAGGTRPIIGYLVDAEGMIDFPVIGKVEAKGLTVNELKAILAEQLAPYLKDPVIIIRFINFRITLTGEVSNPGSYVMPNERVTILDAIGQAGDLTPYANRTNLLIIREQDGQRSFGRINLQNKDIFDSSYFYLRQNDVIYVEPLQERTASIRDQSQRILPWVSVVTAVLTLTLTLTNL
ncbi:MAG: polysaccharide biosynthesis/export family protein [Chitinophagales bacterium]|nr:polysaccharide biosynthesis/export family protein [Chitinophagales bacterium]